MSEGTAWRILLVEDNSVVAGQIESEIPKVFQLPDTAEVEIYSSFEEALVPLREERFDLLILDLKDDSTGAVLDDEGSPGLKIFDALKAIRFTPVVFYTANAHLVKDVQTSFVQVVEKTMGLSHLKEAVQRVFATKLPDLSRKLEEAQRSYMWDFVGSHWKEFEKSHDQGDVAYLLARRMALTLESLADKLAVQVAGAGDSQEGHKNHPMIMYIMPPIESHRLAGDILCETSKEGEQYWIVLTPSCDFAQNKASQVLLAKCNNASAQDEFAKWSSDNTQKGPLLALIGDSRKTQPERYKYLPGTFFMPDLIVDFQQLRSIKMEELDTFRPIAALDSPFAEAVLARFTRYFGRLGTPDVDREMVLNRLKSKLDADASTRTAASAS